MTLGKTSLSTLYVLCRLYVQVRKQDGTTNGFTLVEEDKEYPVLIKDRIKTDSGLEECLLALWEAHFNEINHKAFQYNLKQIRRDWTKPEHKKVGEKKIIEYYFGPDCLSKLMQYLQANPSLKPRPISDFRQEEE